MEIQWYIIRINYPSISKDMVQMAMRIDQHLGFQSFFVDQCFQGFIFGSIITSWIDDYAELGVSTSNYIGVFKKFIKPGDLAIDIGTNIGDTTIPMGLAAGKEGLVLGFDPNPYIFKILKENASLNKDKTNIIPLPYAITEKPGEFTYSSSTADFGNGGISSLSGKTHGKFEIEHKIKGINLMAFLNENYKAYLDKLSFIKIDTEGLDMMIVRSMEDLIRKYQPVVVAECFVDYSNEEKMAFYDLFHDLKYSLHFFKDFDGQTETFPLTRETMTSYSNYNFYAKPIVE